MLAKAMTIPSGRWRPKVKIVRFLFHAPKKVRPETRDFFYIYFGQLDWFSLLTNKSWFLIAKTQRISLKVSQNLEYNFVNMILYTKQCIHTVWDVYLAPKMKLVNDNSGTKKVRKDSVRNFLFFFQDLKKKIDPGGKN